jgi:tyrosine-protein kinase Etk/Wzc
MGNLAVVLSQTGARVLLMDCDLRRSALHRLFAHKKSPGLTELLVGDDKIENFIHNTGIPGLDFISAGITPPNPAELLGSDKMKILLEKFRGHYDTILIDAPPVLAVTDALLLSTTTDMVFMILELGRIPINAVTHALDMLHNVNAPLAGVVLNDKVEHRLERYGYYGEKYYRYRYYGYSHYGYSYYDEEPQKQKEKQTWWRRLLKK